MLLCDHVFVSLEMHLCACGGQISIQDSVMNLESMAKLIFLMKLLELFYLCFFWLIFIIFINNSDVLNQNAKRASCTTILTLAYQSLGVVYGDLSTSPLYVYKTTFSGKLGLHDNDEEIYGVFSFIFWTFTLIALFKYVFIVMSANDNGEGTVLTALLVFLWLLHIQSRYCLMVWKGENLHVKLPFCWLILPHTMRMQYIYDYSKLA